MKYILILIVSMTSNGAAVHTDHVEFNSKSACQEALIEVLREYKRDPASESTNNDIRRLSRMYVDGWCVAKGEVRD